MESIRPLTLRHVRLFVDKGGGRLYAASTWLFVALLILFFGLQARERLAELEQQQIREALRSSRYVSQTVARTLAEQRRLVDLFARQKATDIQRLIREPGHPGALATLHSAMLDFFPDAFAVTVANPAGIPIIDDFDGLVGEVCQGNIRHFAASGQGQPIFMHPHPEVYHYDIMAPFAGHILFISFKPDKIVQSLRENAALGQKMLLYQADKRLLELTAEGTRKDLRRDFHLGVGEVASLLARLPVTGTNWTLGVLPNQEDVERQRKEVLYSHGFSIAGAIFLAVLLHLLIHLEIQRRLKAEEHAREMARISLSDPLTGLPNRRALDEALHREWRDIQRSDTHLIVMMIDVDHFKLYNDSLGHQAGDQALCQVAQALRAALNRPRDLVARFGGEEFVALLPETECQAAPRLAENMHRKVRELALPHPASPTSGQLSISIGVHCAGADPSKLPADLLELADQALYRAKQAGRNQTCIQGAADA